MTRGDFDRWKAKQIDLLVWEAERIQKKAEKLTEEANDLLTEVESIHGQVADLEAESFEDYKGYVADQIYDELKDLKDEGHDQPT